MLKHSLCLYTFMVATVTPIFSITVGPKHTIKDLLMAQYKEKFDCDTESLQHRNHNLATYHSNSVNCFSVNAHNLAIP